jgi:transcriptional regulator with XRE-family HTH domain
MKGLGSRIKVLRRERKLTLVDIAKKTGIDQATLSRIENGKMTGTLDSHMRIAEAIGLRLPELYEAVLNKISALREKNVRQKIETFSHSSGAVAELLTTGILSKKMMPVLLRVKPKGRTETEEFPVGTERFLYVLSGSIQVRLGKEMKILKDGENMYFNASLPHHFENTSKSSDARCLLIMTPASL